MNFLVQGLEPCTVVWESESTKATSFHMMIVAEDHMNLNVFTEIGLLV